MPNGIHFSRKNFYGLKFSHFYAQKIFTDLKFFLPENSTALTLMNFFSRTRCVMFQGQVERKANNIKNLLVYRDRHVIVAINPECVHLFTDSSPRVREMMIFILECIMFLGDNVIFDV